jgi:hypothetical protein
VRGVEEEGGGTRASGLWGYAIKYETTRLISND